MIQYVKEIQTIIKETIVQIVNKEDITYDEVCASLLLLHRKTKYIEDKDGYPKVLITRTRHEEYRYVGIAVRSPFFVTGTKC